MTAPPAVPVRFLSDSCRIPAQPLSRRPQHNTAHFQHPSGGSMSVETVTQPASADVVRYHQLNLVGALTQVAGVVAADTDDYEGLDARSLGLVGGLVEQLHTVAAGLAWRDQAAKLAADGHPVPAPPADVPTGARLDDLIADTRAAVARYQAWDTEAA